MTRRQTAVAATSLAAAGLFVGAARELTADQPRPHAIGLPATQFGQQQPALTPTSPPQPFCASVPGKAWGQQTLTTVVSAHEFRTVTIRPVWHWSPAILHPTRLERYCVTHPAAGGTRVAVSVLPVPAGVHP